MFVESNGQPDVPDLHQNPLQGCTTIGGEALLQFPDTFDIFVPAIAHDGEHAEEIVAGAVTAGGEVSLWRRLADLEALAKEEIVVPCIELAHSLLGEADPVPLGIRILRLEGSGVRWF